MAREESERLLRDIIINFLVQRIGEPDTMSGQGKSARFNVKASFGGGLVALKSPSNMRFRAALYFPTNGMF
jgi:hypothetical protein